MSPSLEIQPVELDEALRRGASIHLIDCRTPHEHELARLEGSELLPLDELPHRLEDLVGLPEGPMVVLCHHGQRSLVMTSVLRRAGRTDVRSLAGGIDRWSREIDPTVPRY
ncbi:MAG: rhodanese-like domain-containing protein [Planctomycetota bacterium]